MTSLLAVIVVIAVFTPSESIAITGKEFLTSPYLTYQQLLRAEPGYVVDRRGLHFRGGRHDDNDFLIEGFSTRNLLVGNPLFFLNRMALNRMVIDGPKASIKTRSGGSRTQLTIRHTTDDFLSPAFDHGMNLSEISLGGPIPLAGLRYFLAGETYKTNDYGFDELAGGRPVDRPKDRYQLFGNLTCPLPSEKGSISVLHLSGREQFRMYDRAWAFNLDRYLAERSRYSLSGQRLDYRITPSIRLTQRFGLVRWNSLQGVIDSIDPGLFGDYRFVGEEVVLGDTHDPTIYKEKLVDSLFDRYTAVSYSGADNPFGAENLFAGQGDYPWWSYKKLRDVTVGAGLSADVGKTNTIGLDYESHFYKMEEYANTDPTDPFPVCYIYSPTSSIHRMRLRHEWTHRGLGLTTQLTGDRAALFPGGWSDPYDTTLWTCREPQYSLWPELSASIITGRDIFVSFTYRHQGIYTPLLHLYRLTPPPQITSPLYHRLGAPSFYRTKRLVEHRIEAGVALDSFTSFSVTAFSKEARDFEAVRTTYARSWSGPYYGIYHAPRQSFFGSDQSSGVEMGVRRALGGYAAARLAYCLSRLNATSCWPRDAYYEIYILENFHTVDVSHSYRYPTDYDQRHKASLELALAVPYDIRFKPLAGLSFHGDISYNSGQPYTLYDFKGLRIGEINGFRKSGYFDINLFAAKGVRVQGFQLMFFGSLLNAFDIRQARNVYPTSGQVDDDGLVVSANQFSSFSVFSSYYRPASDLNHDGIASGDERYQSYLAARQWLLNNPDNYYPGMGVRLGAELRL